MKRSIANVCLFAVGISVLPISLMTTQAEDETDLLKRAQELFQALPKRHGKRRSFRLPKSVQIWDDGYFLIPG